MKRISKILVVSLFIISLSAQMGYANRVSDFFTRSKWSTGIQNGVKNFTVKTIYQDRMVTPYRNYHDPETMLKKMGISKENFSNIGRKATPLGNNTTPLGNNTVLGNSRALNMLKGSNTSASGDETAPLVIKLPTLANNPVVGNSRAPKIPKGWGPWSNVLYMRKTITTTEIKNIGNSSVGK